MSFCNKLQTSNETWKAKLLRMSKSNHKSILNTKNPNSTGDGYGISEMQTADDSTM